MARDFKFTIRKSKKEIEFETAEYSKWAFPHGETQRENLMVLLKGLFPKQDSALVLVSFLSARELYEEACHELKDRQAAAMKLLGKRNYFKYGIKKGEMPVYLTLVLADEEVGEDGVYPSLGEIIAKSAALAKIDPKNLNLAKE